jgi:hypothetical protein
VAYAWLRSHRAQVQDSANLSSTDTVFQQLAVAESELMQCTLVSATAVVVGQPTVLDGCGENLSHIPGRFDHSRTLIHILYTRVQSLENAACPTRCFDAATIRGPQRRTVDVQLVEDIFMLLEALTSLAKPCAGHYCCMLLVH